MTATFMVLLDVSIVNVAIPSIQRNLGASYAQVQFVLAGYQLAYAVMLITGGRLGDIFGRKRLFMLGMTGFVAASAMCGLAVSPSMLVGSRILQGLFAALMYPQVLSVIQVTFSLRERGTAFAILGATMGIATISGPLVGGLLIGSDVTGGSWRLIFLVNVPIGVASLAAAAFLLRESRAPHAPRLDLVGVAIVTAGLFLLTYPLVEGRDAGWPAWAYAMLPASAVVLAVFVLFEKRRTDRGHSPLVELSLFRNRSFRVGGLMSLVFLAGVPAFFLIFMLTLQIGLGFTALHAGLTTVPFSVGSAIGSVASTRLAARIGKRILMLGSGLLVAGMAGVMLTIRARGLALEGAELIPALAVCGLGLGSVVAPLLTIILAGVPPRNAGSASGVISTVQQIGGAIGVSVIGVVFFGLLAARADGVSAQVAPQLASRLAAAGVPQPVVGTVVDGFRTCFHDRAAATDPTAEPATCRQLRQRAQGRPGSTAVQAALADASHTAVGRDFSESMQWSLLYEMGVFGAAFLLVVLLPATRPLQPH
jgi:EmrB/QacA subfamily drug resistance transporter